jgi:hypothetical protein
VYFPSDQFFTIGVDEGIAHNCANPGPEVGTFLKTGAESKSPEEGILHQVASVFLIPGQVECDGVK